MMSEKFAKNHKSFECYIHDLDKYKIGMHNCLSIPFDDLLNNPVSIKTKYDIRSASSISSAAQLIIVYFQTQSMVQFGGVSATHLDWTFVPFVRKSFRKHFKDALIYIEGMTAEEAEKTIQQMENEKSLDSESTK